MRLVWSILLVLVLVPAWSGTPRLALLGRHAVVTATPVQLDITDPERRRVGRLTFLGGVALTSPDSAFGGFSSLVTDGRRFTLLSDGGNIASFHLLPDGRIADPTFGDLPDGPGAGWQKEDRDSESMTRGPDGRLWVGFEVHNQIWRYAPGFAAAERRVAPAAMADWPPNGGPESLVRLHDGRFLVIGESATWPDRPERLALVFAGDPTVTKRPAFAFAYRPAAGFDPSDAAELPNGDLLVLERRFTPWPLRFTARLVRVPAARIRARALVQGEEIARFAPPVIHDNFEGVAVTTEKGAPIVWLVSDNNRFPLQRSLLLKFRLD